MIEFYKKNYHFLHELSGGEGGEFLSYQYFEHDQVIDGLVGLAESLFNELSNQQQTVIYQKSGVTSQAPDQEAILVEELNNTTLYPDKLLPANECDIYLCRKGETYCYRVFNFCGEHQKEGELHLIESEQELTLDEIMQALTEKGVEIAGKPLSLYKNNQLTEQQNFEHYDPKHHFKCLKDPNLYSNLDARERSAMRLLYKNISERGTGMLLVNREKGVRERELQDGQEVIEEIVDVELEDSGIEEKKERFFKVKDTMIQSGLALKTPTETDLYFIRQDDSQKDTKDHLLAKLTASKKWLYLSEKHLFLCKIENEYFLIHKSPTTSVVKIKPIQQKQYQGLKEPAQALEVIKELGVCPENAVLSPLQILYPELSLAWETNLEKYLIRRTDPPAVEIVAEDHLEQQEVPNTSSPSSEEPTAFVNYQFIQDGFLSRAILDDIIYFKVNKEKTVHEIYFQKGKTKTSIDLTPFNLTGNSKRPKIREDLSRLYQAQNEDDALIVLGEELTRELNEYFLFKNYDIQISQVEKGVYPSPSEQPLREALVNFMVQEDGETLTPSSVISQVRPKPGIKFYSPAIKDGAPLLLTTRELERLGHLSTLHEQVFTISQEQPETRNAYDMLEKFVADLEIQNAYSGGCPVEISFYQREGAEIQAEDSTNLEMATKEEKDLVRSKKRILILVDKESMRVHLGYKKKGDYFEEPLELNKLRASSKAQLTKLIESNTSEISDKDLIYDLNGILIRKKSETSISKGTGADAGADAYGPIVEFMTYYNEGLSDADKRRFPKEIKKEIEFFFKLCTDKTANTDAVVQIETCIGLRGHKLRDLLAEVGRPLKSIPDRDIHKEQFEQERLARTYNAIYRALTTSLHAPQEKKFSPILFNLFKPAQLFLLYPEIKEWEKLIEYIAPLSADEKDSFFRNINAEQWKEYLSGISNVLRFVVYCNSNNLMTEDIIEDHIGIFIGNIRRAEHLKTMEKNLSAKSFSMLITEFEKDLFRLVTLTDDKVTFNGINEFISAEKKGEFLELIRQEKKWLYLEIVHSNFLENCQTSFIDKVVKRAKDYWDAETRQKVTELRRNNQGHDSGFLFEFYRELGIEETLDEKIQRLERQRLTEFRDVITYKIKKVLGNAINELSMGRSLEELLEAHPWLETPFDDYYLAQYFDNYFSDFVLPLINRVSLTLTQTTYHPFNSWQSFNQRLHPKITFHCGQKAPIKERIKTFNLQCPTIFYPISGLRERNHPGQFTPLLMDSNFQKEGYQDFQLRRRDVFRFLNKQFDGNNAPLKAIHCHLNEGDYIRSFVGDGSPPPHLFSQCKK